MTPVPRSRAYAGLLAVGLLDAGAWDVDTVAACIASSRGAVGHWSDQAIPGPRRGVTRTLSGPGSTMTDRTPACLRHWMNHA
ncbi:hypothetical protein P8A22_10240 [Streptomyces laculatispora]|uniref:Uncharacterized protein n=1 Tax=Streptomyces laculatispora TaxID=887464 RepID=A0ABY9I1E5_9ACTN|nr:hypothetical protein [Streptomyces laculatispora]WLQ40346.1 hypothetical protein P8A22_10240 [Streptomyces laculatispora]